MNGILKFASIISLIIATLKLAFAGLLSQGWVVFILICGVVILAGGRKVLIVTAAFTGLVLFIRIYSRGNDVQAGILLKHLIILALVLFGIYTMLKGVSGSKNNNRY